MVSVERGDSPVANERSAALKPHPEAHNLNPHPNPCPQYDARTIRKPVLPVGKPARAKLLRKFIECGKYQQQSEQTEETPPRMSSFAGPIGKREQCQNGIGYEMDCFVVFMQIGDCVLGKMRPQEQGRRIDEQQVTEKSAMAYQGLQFFTW